jgi:hypothetical protein
MVLVIGPKRKYWPRVSSRVGTDWNIFIDKYVYPSLREIKTDEELREAKSEPDDGGTTFHLETPKNGSELMRELANLSKEFRIYNDTFTYRVRASLAKAVLTAHIAPGCSVEWTGGTLREFLEKYKFGSRHEYDRDEYKALVRESKTALVMADEGLIGGLRYTLERLPGEFCHKVVFGWIKMRNAKKIVKGVKQNISDPPFMLYTDPKQCWAVNRGRVADAVKSGFLRKAVDGKLCGRIYFPSNNMTVTTEAVVEDKVTGNRLSVVYFATLLTTIAVIRIFTPEADTKEE